MKWDDYLAEAVVYLKTRQERLKSEFGLGHWKQWFYDQEAGNLTFSTDGKIGVVATMHVVGSTSKSTGTWLWSWDNATILDQVKHCILEVRDFGEAHSFEKLTNPKWPGDEYDAWEMTAVAAYILQAEGAYRAPDDNGALFLVMRDVRRVT